MTQPIDIKPQSPIVAIFERSRLYGGRYDGDSLPLQWFPFPDDTWLQRRLRELRMQGDEREQD